MSDIETGILGGPEKRKIIIAPYSDDWPRQYAAHATRISQAVAHLPHEIQHVGSTSVPGLGAKPIIDMVLALPDPAAEEAYLPHLVALGLELRVREPDFDQHRMLRTPSRDLHLHIYPTGSDEITRYLLLRDALRADADLRARYEALKRRLAARDWDDMNDYADAQSGFIEVPIARARAQRPS